ncbi:MAG: UDP-4-amino-4,6-dideoxy-N-acetyl-beta-L-altrosamine transaminase [Spirochaetes bacterium]|nr:MAG: UDP-4-amino-4,6-dideoxy-N-acetyl-beta-L-altrosamine transaminase [Spirochaetota bacterium]
MNLNTDFIPFSRPSMGKEEEKAVIGVLRSGWLTTGSEAKSFENEFASYVNVKHALSLSSATAGLHLGLEALNIRMEDLVITSPYTFVATAETIRYLGAHPLFVDIEKDSFNIDPCLIEKAIKENKERVKAIVPVHVGGHSCRMKEILSLSAHSKIPVLEDAAHAFPVKTEMGYIGALGDVGVYSFYATKPITTGEGGMLVTNREDVAKRVSVMRLHGFNKDAWDRYLHTNRESWKYDIIEAGYKYNLSDIAAALGRVQLRRAEELRKKREKIAYKYISSLAECDFLILPPQSKEHSWHLFIIQLKEDKLKIGRDAFIEKLTEAKIGTSVHYIPLHVMSYYKSHYGFKPGDFPRALKKYSSAISLPIYAELTEEQTERIIRVIKEIGEHNYRSKYDLQH